VVEELFTYWAEATRRDPNRCKLTGDRERLAIKRLTDKDPRSRFTADDLRAAIDGVASSAFHRGENDQKQRYDTFEWILSSPSKIEKWREKGLALRTQPSEAQAAQDAMNRELESKGVTFCDNEDD
jgi:hypothetical protein